MVASMASARRHATATPSTRPRESVLSEPRPCRDASRNTGSQAIKALKEEGIEVVLINPNIATVQTSREDASSVDVERHKSEPIADHLYLLPVTADNVRHILDKEKNIDGAFTGVLGGNASRGASRPSRPPRNASKSKKRVPTTWYDGENARRRREAAGRSHYARYRYHRLDGRPDGAQRRD